MHRRWSGSFCLLLSSGQCIDATQLSSAFFRLSCLGNRESNNDADCHNHNLIVLTQIVITRFMGTDHETNPPVRPSLGVRKYFPWSNSKVQRQPYNCPDPRVNDAEKKTRRDAMNGWRWMDGPRLVLHANKDNDEDDLDVINFLLILRHKSHYNVIVATCIQLLWTIF